MNILENRIVEGRHGKPISIDIYYITSGQAKPVILFAHGFKGFKDWGHWHLIAQEFAKAGYVFVKFNFAYNGTTPEQPTDFADLEAFGENNYMKELDDLDVVIDWLHQQPEGLGANEMKVDDLTLIGHSRGGGIAVLKAYHDERIKQVITWAAVHSLARGWSNEALIQQWKEKGVSYILNGRTKQQMPLYYQLYENYKANEAYLNVEQAARALDKPLLIIHGTKDPAVPLTDAQFLHQWNAKSQLHIIEDANHVFGGRHPYTEIELPPHTIELVQQSLVFLKSIS